MHVVNFLLAIVPVVLSQLEPENEPRPSIAQYTTINGVCDPSIGNGASLSGREGTLKACAAACLENANCKGFNFVTDFNQCLIFRQECESARQPGRNEPTQNFYLRGEIACGASTVGNEFVVAFMANRVAQPRNMSLEIWLTQDKELGGSTVKLITDASQGLNRDVSVPYKQAVSTLIPFTWKVSDVDAGVTIEKKAVYLQSDVDFVFYGVNKEYFTADAFLGIPVRSLGTRYIANCFWPPFYNCEFAVTPALDNTTITITLPRTPARNEGNWAKAPTGISSCNLPFGGQTYTNGQTLTFKLQKFEVAQIQDPCDLTGAIIESDKPIAFWSGNSRVNIGDSPSRDHQVEQLFSTDTWGTDCAAWPTPNRAEGLVDYWVITAAEDNTVIKVESSEAGETSYTLNAAESVRFPARSVREWQRFSSRKKFQAVQYASSAVDNSIPGDPSMTTCIPSDQFGFGYTFVTPTGVATTYTNFLTLITKKGGEGGFVLDGQPVRGIEWNDIPGSDLVGGFVKLDTNKQQFRIEHRVRGTTFEAYIYGSGDRESIAYPTGACIKALGECVRSTMFIADGKDNDCDGVVDEELFDGIDNDFDGQVDEDCYARKAVSQDRCPATKIAQSCFQDQLNLACDGAETIKIIEAHFGRLGLGNELTCNSENPIATCGGGSNCGWWDISTTLMVQCDGQASCSLPVSQFYMMDSGCPQCSLYAHVQYVCLNQKEQENGILSGRNQKASSYLQRGEVDAKCNKWIYGQSSIHMPPKADFGSNAVEAWRPAQCDKDSSWLQIDLGSVYAVGWYAISGCRFNDYWITKFGISHSLNGKEWTIIKNAAGELRLFDGNSDSNTAKVCTLFAYNIVARYVRIHPAAYNGYPCAHLDFGHSATGRYCDATKIANSNFANGGSAAYGQLATVTCNHGWATGRGETEYSLQCQADGKWSGEFRGCTQLLHCSDIPSISGGYFSATSNQPGATVTYRCFDGRRLVGQARLTCGENGQWSSEAPVCELL